MKEPLHILILEDNSADADIEKFELQEAGFIFTSRVVANENEYIQELQNFSPDLILSDYDLPQYNGSRAQIEAKSRCPDIPFILVTGAVSEDLAIEILTQGAKDYVLKNRLQQRLVPAVRRALAEAEEHRARIRAEQELQKANKELERLIEERTCELRKSEERHRQFVETAHGWVWEVDSHVTYTYVSPQVQAILGYAPEELLGKKPFDLMPDDEATHIVEAFAAITAKREPFKKLHNINRHKDGRFIILETNGVPFFDEKGNLLGYRGMDHDITVCNRPEKA